MNKAIAVCLAIAFGMGLLPGDSQAEQVSLSQRRQILFLRNRLERIPDRSTNITVIRRLTLQLTRLAPGRAAAWLNQASQRTTLRENPAFERLADAVKTVVRNSPSVPSNVQSNIDRKVDNIVIERGAASPTPTPYQA